MTGFSESKKLPKRPILTDLPAYIADDIRTQIIKGKLKPGSKLPTQLELEAQHGVSRVVVREAIARLRHEGLVISHQGRGVFVASLEGGRFLTIEDGALSKPGDYRSLYEVRKILESGTASMAATHHQLEDIQAMERELAHMTDPSVDPEIYVSADIAFHRAIASASKNPFLALFNSFVDQKLKESIKLALTRLDFVATVKVSKHEHEALLECIKIRDSEGARIAMETHLENSSKRLGI